MRFAFLLISVAIYASVVFKNQYRIPHRSEKKRDKWDAWNCSSHLATTKRASARDQAGTLTAADREDEENMALSYVIEPQN